MKRGKTAAVVLGAALIAASGAGAQVVVDGRLVETKPAGGCVDQLVTSQQRYADCGNGTVWDLATDLLWLKSGTCGWPGLPQARGSWLEAHAAAAATGHGLDCGSFVLTDGSQPGDWRLPTFDEWIDTVDRAIGLGCLSPTLTGATGTDCGPSGMSPIAIAYPYWTGTGVATDPTEAWSISLADASFSGSDKDNPAVPPFVWPVRPAGSTATGGRVSVDGAPVEEESAPPCGNLSLISTSARRYQGSGHGTVCDLVTGLVWMKNANCFGEIGWPQAMAAVATLADGVCGLNDDSQPGDWRLPTREEWEATLAPAALGCSPAITGWAGTGCIADEMFPPFSPVPETSYWSSTTLDFIPQTVFYARLSDGDVTSITKTSVINVWAVRSGR